MKELELLQRAVEATTRYNEIADTYIGMIKSFDADKAEQVDVQQIARYADAISILASENMAGMLKKSREIVGLIGIDETDDFSVNDVIARLDKLVSKIEGRTEFQESLRLFFACLDERLSLQIQCEKLAAIQRMNSDFRDAALQLYKMGLIPEPPSKAQ